MKLLATIARWCLLAPSALLIACVRCYQLFLSPLMPSVCIYRPSCSAYYIQAVKKYGAISGSLRGAWRICRCHPFARGGYDPP